MPPLKSLAEIADDHGCDKGLAGPSHRWSANNYVDVYEALFRSIREEFLNLLEIGIGVTGEQWNAEVAHGRNVGGGASLKMWAEYFPNACIYGLDINDAAHLNSDRIRTYRVDQGSREELRRFLQEIDDFEFDIVIDDGSHRADHQQISLEEIWPRLKRGGSYFIEDLNDRSVGVRGGERGELEVIVPTRRLLRSLLKSGQLEEPNAFAESGFLREIEDVVFFCPRPLLRPRDLALEVLRTLLGRHKRGLLRTEYGAESHRLVALRKQAARA